MAKVSRPARPVILVADDTPANLGVLFELLGQNDYDVMVAEDGESALQRVEHTQPDLILLDVVMPNLDGFETCRRLKSSERTRDIPVIFMTGLTETVDKLKGFALGAVDYITKPFQQEEVLARVRTHLTLQRVKAELAENEERLTRIIDGAMDAIVTLDGEGRITLFNHAAEQVFHCTVGAALGRAFADYLSSDLRRALEGHMGAERGSPASKQAVWLPPGLVARRAEGTEFPVEATLSRVEVRGRPLYTLILRDIEERRRQEAAFNRLHGLTLSLQDEIRREHNFEEIIGGSGTLKAALEAVEQVAPTDATVLVTGETGTGKELIARAIHDRSRRQGKALVKLNCATLPAGLVESELSGHEKGSFTGAYARKLGRFELADGATLFLDEIGELPLDLQSKLLRVLQEGEFERVGGSQTFKVDVRVVAATNRDLEAYAGEGKFRSDLYYRLKVFPIALPPLRERREDIPALVRHFVGKHAAKLGRRIETVAPETLTLLKNYSWPGNIRELDHIIERAVIVTQGPTLAFGDWLREPGGAPPSAAFPTLDETERAHIVKALEQCGWRVSGEQGAAKLLDMPATTLESRMKRMGLTRPS